MWKYPKDVLSDLMNDDFSNLIWREIFFTLTGEELIRFRFVLNPFTIAFTRANIRINNTGQRTDTEEQFCKLVVNVSLNATTPRLATLYEAIPGNASKPAVDAVFMMWPAPHSPTYVGRKIAHHI